MKSRILLILLIVPFIFLSCDKVEPSPQDQILGDWKLVSSEALLHIRNKKPEESKSDLDGKNLVMTFSKNGTYEIKVDDNITDDDVVDLDAFYLNNKGTYVIKNGFLEFNSTEFASDLKSIKYKVVFNNSNTFEMEVDRELYLDMIRKIVESQWSYFQTFGKTVDDVMVDLSGDLLEYKSKSKYLRVK